ncbi:MAG: CBS domain-containing protein [Chloroflexi bacterium]|nr:CBS domain-containing protein [Chloroflexota bacterium]
MALVRDYMHRGVITCHLDTPVKEIAKIMDANNIRSVVVTDDRGEVWGIVSLISILKAWGKDLEKLTAEDILQPYTVTISPESPIEEAVKLLQKKRIEHLVIVHPGVVRRAVGILTTFDIIQHMAGMPAGTYRASMQLG